MANLIDLIIIGIDAENGRFEVVNQKLNETIIYLSSLCGFDSFHFGLNSAFDGRSDFNDDTNSEFFSVQFVGWRFERYGNSLKNVIKAWLAMRLRDDKLCKCSGK